MISLFGFTIPLLDFIYLITMFILWLGFSIAVGIGANTRGRRGVGWFFLAVLITPPLAGIVLLVLPSTAVRTLPLAGQGPKFEADGMLSGVPYRKERDGRIA